jgi:hypothetical protein
MKLRISVLALWSNSRELNAVITFQALVRNTGGKCFAADLFLINDPQQETAFTWVW